MMPWNEVNTVDLRREFVALAERGSLSVTALSERYGISRNTAYKWIRRFRTEGPAGLVDRSRRPHHQPRRTPQAMEALVVDCRLRYPVWCGRKLRRVLQNEGHRDLPSPSTITEILRRHGLLHKEQAAQANYIRFEHPHPNDLWQMDFKGDFALLRGRCHPLTVLDDHSRFSVCLTACKAQTTGIVKNALIQTFSQYGIPRRMTMDNGSPWGSSGTSRYTQLTVWLIEQGIQVGHSRPYHPQTQGKDERFHKTLNIELLGRRQLGSLKECQREFNGWRHRYNTIRPHDALALDTPANHYEPSQRSYDAAPKPYVYSSADAVRKVGKNLKVSFHRREIFLGMAFEGKHIALRPTIEDGKYTMHYCHQQIGRVDLNSLKRRMG